MLFSILLAKIIEILKYLLCYPLKFYFPIYFISTNKLQIKYRYIDSIAYDSLKNWNLIFYNIERKKEEEEYKINIFKWKKMHY